MATLDDSVIGVDLRCTFGPTGAIDIDPYFGTVTGAALVAQDVATRLTSPRGSLFWAADVGRDVRALLNESLDESDLKVEASKIATEVRADERIDPESVVVTLSFDSSTSTLTVTVQGATKTAGPFTLVIAVSIAGIAIRAEAA